MSENVGEPVSSPYPENVPDVKVLDTLLKCGICYEYMNIALITPCSHNFCSLCIRKFMQYKTSCPQCFANVTETELKNNRILDEMVLAMQRLKTQLHRALSKEESAPKPAAPELEPKTPVKEIKEPVKEIGQPEKEAEPVSCASLVLTPAKELLDESFKSAPRTPEAKSEKSKSMSIWESMENMSRSPKAGSSKVVPMVSCPICQVQIPERNINLHIDKCLERSDQSEEKTANFKPQILQQTHFVTRKRLPKLVYDLMKDADLRKKCAEANLSTQGDKKTLIKRHRRYTLLYNSECDSTNPRPTKEIVKQVEKEEREESMANCKTWKALKVDRKADPKVIEQAQAKYKSENQSHFSKLLNDLQQRHNKSDAKTNGEASASKAEASPGKPPPEHTPPANGDDQPDSPGTPNSEMDFLLTQQESPVLRKKQVVTKVAQAEEEDSDDLFSPIKAQKVKKVSPILIESDEDDFWEDAAPKKSQTKKRQSSSIGSQEDQPLRRSTRPRKKTRKS